MKRRFFAGCICVVLLIGMTAVPVLGENLKYGSEGSQVVQAQTRLSVLGFYQGEADGKFGYSTFLAVKGFQAANGLTADGVIGEVTIARLYSDGALDNNGAAGGSGWHLRVAYGSAGPAVSLIQGLLRNLNYYSGPVDAKFGFSTFLAVKEFQGLNGLTADGIVGPLTWDKLFGPAALPKPIVTPEPEVLRVAYGDEGALVTQVQTRLTNLGYYELPVDGKFGYATYLSVRDFQVQNALKVDGIVGPFTWGQMMGPAAVAK